MESNEQTELTNKTETDSVSESRIAAKVGWEERLGEGGSEKGLNSDGNRTIKNLPFVVWLFLFNTS